MLKLSVYIVEAVMAAYTFKSLGQVKKLVLRKPHTGQAKTLDGTTVYNHQKTLVCTQ